MEVLAKGQLSYLILACLEERDMYGLELIEKIKEKSGIEIKMPSLYSNINRMKELKYISSYLKESSKGPKCAYSSITENGRIELARLKEVFGDSTPVQEEAPVENDEEEEITIIHETPVEEKADLLTEKFDDYNDYFSIPSEEEKTEEVVAEPIVAKIEEESKSMQEIKEEKVILEKETDDEEEIQETGHTPVQEKLDVLEDRHDGGVFLPREEKKIEVDEETQRLYNVSREYNRSNTKKIGENQIGLVAAAVPTLAKEQSQVKMNENVDGLKQALLDSRQNHYEEVKLEEKEPLIEEKISKQDDGVFITDKIEYVPRNRRIEPPRMNILTTAEPKLPAPRRNVNIDPNCSDVRARIESLYSKTQNDAPIDERRMDVGFDNYDDLKNYYESQNVSFKVYKRSDKKPAHNTNKILFYVELIMFGIIGLGSGLLYLLFSQLGLINPTTNFLYYVLPILYFIYLCVRLYMYKKVPSATPKPLFNFIIVWGVALLFSGLTFGLNLIRTPIMNLLNNSTTLFLPIFVYLVAIVVRHYALLIAFRKYWK